ncbi:MAG: Txe/YoeB family addiction module toxin [Oscillospiraceae bacterium]|nr:Txe/YoeB family addiction module toxin [Oscillospiraceae bacterium]
MKKIWSDESWKEYVYWQANDKKTLTKINKLIKSIERDGLLKGEGEPEKLIYRKGYSRRINKNDRLEYDIIEINNVKYLAILSCKGHYEE